MLGPGIRPKSGIADDQRPHDAVRKDRGPLLDRPLHAVVLNRYVVDLLLYFVGTDVFDIVDFDATKSLSCLHAISLEPSSLRTRWGRIQLGRIVTSLATVLSLPAQLQPKPRPPLLIKLTGYRLLSITIIATFVTVEGGKVTTTTPWLDWVLGVILCTM